MAGHGPAPKPADKRRRRNAPGGASSLTADGQLRGMPLPRGGWTVRQDGELCEMAWPEATRSWWLNWRKSAQAQSFSPSDWDFLLETAVLHARFWTGDHSVSGELRLRVAKFGATPEDRLRLRMEINPDEPAEEPASKDLPANVTDFRSRAREAR